ncbi:MAG TPA: hypothetical protein PLS56_01830 [Candidatus Dojkabacteria bacterium]|nr:hypothetical protein [Candidatus Dojkabacteria bacterium]
MSNSLYKDSRKEDNTETETILTAVLTVKLSICKLPALTSSNKYGVIVKSIINIFNTIKHTERIMLFIKKYVRKLHLTVRNLSIGTEHKIAKDRKAYVQTKYSNLTGRCIPFPKASKTK